MIHNNQTLKIFNNNKTGGWFPRSVNGLNMGMHHIVNVEENQSKTGGKSVKLITPMK